MVITNDVKLPCDRDLEVDEVNVSHGCLMSAAPYIGKYCENVNSEFMLCRQELKDPRACIEVGKAVTSCTRNLLKMIKCNCLEEFQQYQNCIDKSSGDYSFKHCRKTQEAFDSCMQDKVGICRPAFGYFCRGRVHRTAREKPPAEPCPCHPKYKDEPPSLPDEKLKESSSRPARFTSRFYWLNE